jgi:CRP-like cAMP-binding protein
VAELEATGRAMVSTTRLHGRYAVRMVVLNHLTQESDVRWTLDFFARTQIPASLLIAADSPVGRDGSLLDLLSDVGRRRLESRSFRRRVPMGTRVVSRWGTDRDLYVVLGGEVTAHVDGEEVSRLGAGDFFGEIAASDWGSGYGRLRSADVIAVSEASILMIPVEVMGELMASEPAFRDRVIAVRTERLTRRVR